MGFDKFEVIQIYQNLQLDSWYAFSQLILFVQFWHLHLYLTPVRMLM